MTRSSDCCNSGDDFLDVRRLGEDDVKGLRLGRRTAGKAHGDPVQGAKMAKPKETGVQGFEKITSRAKSDTLFPQDALNLYDEISSRVLSGPCAREKEKERRVDHVLFAKCFR